MWKIPDIQRQRGVAREDETAYLQSDAFYTSRQGYKVCLRLYLNGYGSGKGTHLSLFFVLMSGDNDAILPWPFDKIVSVALINQDNGPDMTQTLQPDYTPLRPRHQEMNIASGCPLFCPLSILSNPAYIKDGTLFIRCEVQTPKTLKITLNFVPDS